MCLVCEKPQCPKGTGVFLCYTVRMAFDPNKITYFAETDSRGKKVRFGIKAKDRQRHMYVIGKTGMGKSTLLENMAVQDILNGEGMAFIDPHGSAAETLLNYIPEHRINDVLYFAPFDTEHPVSFNIMEDVGPEKRHLVVSGLMSVFKKIWIDAWSARMEYILSNTLLALLEYPDSTLLGVNRMLSDKDYRKLVVDNVKDPGVRAFWVDEFAKYNERYMQEAGDAIKNKIGQFTSNPIIRNIIGQPKSSFDIRTMMDEKKILIMNLSKGLIGESNANLLGSMLTTRIYLAAMSRADLSPEKMREMPNFYFFVDEFQSFANATFANILSEARKYHLNLTIAHQYITQMEEEVRDAVFGNVGTIVSFRVGPLDAELLETIFTPQFLATDIVNLSFAQIYLTLMIDGIGSPPFSAATLPSIAPPSTSCKEMAIAASRARFTQPRALVEELVHKFHEPIVVPKKVTKTVFPDREVASVKEQTPQVPREEVRKEVALVREQAPPVHREEVRAVQKDHTNGDRGSERPRRHEVHTTQERRNHDGKDRPPVSKNPTPSTQVPQVSDLRSILKQIAQTDSVKAMGTDEKKNSIVKTGGHRVELKSVLSTVLKEEKNGTEESGAIETSTPPKTETAPMLQSVPVSTPATPVPAQAPSTVSETKERQVPTQAKAPLHADPLSPKELERMMRVTTSDKPPI